MDMANILYQRGETSFQHYTSILPLQTSTSKGSSCSSPLTYETGEEISGQTYIKHGLAQRETLADVVEG